MPITPPLTPLQRDALTEAISPDRLRTYQSAARDAGSDVLELYLWDRDLAAAALADIAVLEVAMRNAMNRRLAEIAERLDWYAADVGLDDRSLRTIAQAWNRLPAQQRTPGRVVAQLLNSDGPGRGLSRWSPRCTRCATARPTMSRWSTASRCRERAGV